MTKRIHHMGMTLAKPDHERFHRAAPELTDKQHDALMKRMGVSREQDEEWHRTHLTLAEQRTQGLTRIDIPAVSSAFVQWCVSQGWLIQRGSEYFATKTGHRNLADRFEIQVHRARR